MYDETKEFLNKFWETKHDVQVRHLFDGVMRLVECSVFLAAFRYAGKNLDIGFMNVAFWVLLVLFSGYVGNRISFLMAGFIRGRGPVTHRNRRTVIISGMVMTLTVMLPLRFLIDAVVLATSLQASPRLPEPITQTCPTPAVTRARAASDSGALGLAASCSSTSADSAFRSAPSSIEQNRSSAPSVLKQ